MLTAGFQQHAVQVIPDILLRHRKMRLLYQPPQGPLGYLDCLARLDVLDNRKLRRWQGRQIEYRAPGLQRQARLVPAGLNRNLCALRQFADDVVEGVRRRRGGPWLRHFGRQLVDHRQIHIGRGQRQGRPLRFDQDIGEDGDGIAALDDALHMRQGFQERGAFNGQLHDAMLGLRALVVITIWCFFVVLFSPRCGALGSELARPPILGLAPGFSQDERAHQHRLQACPKAPPQCGCRV